ncbi:MAG: AAA family ATPase, partial [Spirochaetales bacterium]|nr:AAA family ATPase [Spirochaetales bacterium]
MLKEITGSEIRLSYSNYSFNDVEAGEKIIGQDKALGLLRLGLSMNRYGYNIFISGEDGTGRLSAIRQEIEKIEKDVSGLKDAAYAYSSKHPNRPTCLIFEKGKAREFQKDLYKYKDGEITKEQLLYAFQDEKIARFVNSLPPYDENQDAWKINIVLDRTGFTRRPLVIETHPSHSSLFGSIEKDLEPHLSVRVGSYQEASGGFLVLNAAEIVEDEELWTSLKRYLDMTHRAISSTAVQGEMSSSVRPSP